MEFMLGASDRSVVGNWNIFVLFVVFSSLSPCFARQLHAPVDAPITVI
jgi:hypothetical protein